MREIKFRAWDKTRKVIVDDFTEGMTIEFLGLGGFIVRVGELATEIGDETQFELMQFTGLLDRNGTKIYEGDIISAPDYHAGIAEVKYGDNHAAAWTVNGWLLGAIDKADIKVIGNIYENPELITEQRELKTMARAGTIAKMLGAQDSHCNLCGANLSTGEHVKRQCPNFETGKSVGVKSDAGSGESADAVCGNCGKIREGNHSTEQPFRCNSQSWSNWYEFAKNRSNVGVK